MGLYEIKNWVEENGPVQAMGRLRLKLLMRSLEEDVTWGALTPQTPCSPEYLEDARKAATEVVGKPCPV